MRDVSDLKALIIADPVRWKLVQLVASLALPDAWLAAGVVRSAVWDHLHGRAPSPIESDVDVIWYDVARCDPALDGAAEAALRTLEPGIDWSVKNQARMHARNGDAPYASATDAMRFWPETATAVAIRLDGHSGCEVAAPFGLDDLFSLVVRPTPRFVNEKHDVYEARWRSKRWSDRWPLLQRVKVTR